MRSIDDSLALEFMEKYQGKSLSVDHIINLLGKQLGSESLPPTVMDPDKYYEDPNCGAYAQAKHVRITTIPTKDGEKSAEGIVSDQSNFGIFHPIPWNYRSLKGVVKVKAAGFKTSKSTLNPSIFDDLIVTSRCDNDADTVAAVNEDDTGLHLRSATMFPLIDSEIEAYKAFSSNETPVNDDAINAVRNQLIKEGLLPSTQAEKLLTESQIKQLGERKVTFGDLEKAIRKQNARLDKLRATSPPKAIPYLDSLEIKEHEFGYLPKDGIDLSFCPAIAEAMENVSLGSSQSSQQDDHDSLSRGNAYHYSPRKTRVAVIKIHYDDESDSKASTSRSPQKGSPNERVVRSNTNGDESSRKNSPDLQKYLTSETRTSSKNLQLSETDKEDHDSHTEEQSSDMVSKQSHGVHFTSTVDVKERKKESIAHVLEGSEIKAPKYIASPSKKAYKNATVHRSLETFFKGEKAFLVGDPLTPYESVLEGLQTHKSGVASGAGLALWGHRQWRQKGHSTPILQSALDSQASSAIASSKIGSKKVKSSIVELNPVVTRQGRFKAGALSVAAATIRAQGLRIVDHNRGGEKHMHREYIPEKHIKLKPFMG
jgi:hypothetical protein